MGTASSILSSLASGSTGTSSTSTSTAASAGTSSSATSLAGNFNTFLTLLTTQLKNQDPSDPVDSNQFTQQLVEFAGVQQQVQSNTLLQQLVTNSTTNQVSSASSFVGTTMQASGNSLGLSGGNGTFGYTLPSAASSAIVTIKDSAGNIVYTGSGTTNAGSNLVQRGHGSNSFTGATEPDGTYSFSVAKRPMPTARHLPRRRLSAARSARLPSIAAR